MNMNAKRVPRLLLVLIFILFLILSLVGCGSNDPGTIIENITGVTATPVTPSPSPTPTLNCPPIALELAELSTVSTFVAVVFDEELIENYPLVYENGQPEANPYIFLSDVLSRALGPGSEYSLFRMGYRRYDHAKIIRDASRIVSAPELVSTPAPPDALEAIPTPTKSGVTIADVKATQDYAAQVVRQVATQTQIALEYQCQLSLYESEYQATQVAWGTTQLAEKERIQDTVLTAQPTGELPPEAYQGSLSVYEGLAHATVDFQSRCSEYSRCVLIIIDDLQEWRPRTPDYLSINLSGYDVAIVVPTCSEIVSPECSELQDKWIPQFRDDLGSSDIQFVNSNGSERGEGLDVFLLNYLERE